MVNGGLTIYFFDFLNIILDTTKYILSIELHANCFGILFIVILIGSQML